MKKVVVVLTLMLTSSLTFAQDVPTNTKADESTEKENI
jgi:hypothetical protein